ncbi:E3 SUMO-protein ligase SIZ2-like [Phragmites australis]|uniref:E3 SUMO-protein ligase SIZ2-like n=1 Tax=Phragmites australis TaxID=29695 RepID=UPI002D791B3B|nr:E3 SUMO-protein ligase SIZ2-like [Phragmites australis]
MAPEAADDPVLAACKYKLNHFRIKELKDVLHQLGLPKQGKKQELVDKVIAVLFDQQDQVSKMNGLPTKKMAGRETVVKIVEDTFRKMQDPTNTVAASRSHIESGYNVKPKKKSDDSAQLDVKVRCPCGNSIPKDPMIKCVDPQCNVWQHVGCVIIPEKPADSISPEVPTCFYCEMCRINRADPFWVTVNHPLLPILIAPSNIAADGSYTAQYTAKSFPLSRANREMLQKAEYDLQVWCILLNDKVPFRMHWPLRSDMQVNGIHVRVVNRQPTQQLGANGRDDGPVLTDYLREGPNKIALSRNDSRTFCLGIRIAKRRSLEQVLNLVPKEQDGEKFDDALARVRRCVGGGTEANNADSDSDIEVVADSVSVNLRCPMTASRIRIAGRFKPCAHMGCFDLEAFIEINQRSRKWQCPICLKNCSLESIIIDPYFNRITSLIQSCIDDASEIDVKPDGSWRVKGGAELKDLTQWHLPDGTLCVTTDTRAKPNMGIVKHEIKEEPLSEELGCRLKLGIRKNSNGQWEISKRGDTDLVRSSDSDHARHFENKNCTTLTSNIDDADTEDESYNLDPGRNDCPMSHVHDLDSSPTDENVPPAPREQDIIVLSDSDDDIVTVLSPSAVNYGSALDTGNVFPPKPPETSGVCGEQAGRCPNETSFVALNEDFSDLGLSFWECPLSPQDDPTDQMFDPSRRVTDNPGEAQNNPANYQSKHESVSGGNLGVLAVAANPPEDGHDGALQICASSERDGSISPANRCDHTQTCHDFHSVSWTSLSLSGADESLIGAKNASQKRRSSGDGITALDASVLRSTNDDEPTGERCRDPFSPPLQQRSVRPRLILNIDSDSD